MIDSFPLIPVASILPTYDAPFPYTVTTSCQIFFASNSCWMPGSQLPVDASKLTYSKPYTTLFLFCPFLDSILIAGNDNVNFLTTSFKIWGPLTSFPIYSPYYLFSSPGYCLLPFLLGTVALVHQLPTWAEVRSPAPEPHWTRFQTSSSTAPSALEWQLPES